MADVGEFLIFAASANPGSGLSISSAFSSLRKASYLQDLSLTTSLNALYSQVDSNLERQTDAGIQSPLTGL